MFKHLLNWIRNGVREACHEGMKDFADDLTSGDESEVSREIKDRLNGHNLLEYAGGEVETTPAPVPRKRTTRSKATTK